jgi:hypothetical protein
MNLLHILPVIDSEDSSTKQVIPTVQMFRGLNSDLSRIPIET